MPDDRLERQRELGSPGMARRFGAAEVEGSDRLEVARAFLAKAERAVGLPVQQNAQGKEVMPLNPNTITPLSKAPASQHQGPGPKARGRPKVEGERPWEAAGMSRRTWYRRQAK